MKVMKFGGTSVGMPQRMHGVAKLISENTGSKIVVLSAIAGTTNSLVAISDLLSKSDRIGAMQQIVALEKQYRTFIQELVINPSSLQVAENILKEHFEFLNIILRISYSEALNKDILAQGELLSSKLFSAYLQEQGIDHVLISALEFMTIDSDDEPQIGNIKVKLSQLLQQHKSKNLFITQGFVCRNAKGEVDNLKRGGSDYSASLISAAVGAEVCEIWTDISGMHNCDPAFVNNTIPIDNLSFDEAAELAYFGAKILHPASIWPAQQYNIPVKLLNTMEPHAKGTFINADATSKGVKAIAAKDGITAINIKSSRMLLAYGFLRKVFQIFEKYKTPIDMVTTSEVAVSVTIDNLSFLKNIIKELDLLGVVSVDRDQTIVCIVGNELASDASFLTKVFDNLSETDVRMVSYGGSAHNISILIPGIQKKAVLQKLNKGLFG